MELMVTSGGTIAWIDNVRHIGNFSAGTTGAQIAEEFLRRGAVVHYVHYKRARRPFRGDLALDPAQPLEGELVRARQAYEMFHQHVSRLHEYHFETFDDYYEIVRGLLSTKPLDAVVLAAAVSDYGPEAQPGKLSSDEEKLRIELVKYPKVISLVKEWNRHVFQVGFKLLVDTPVDELVEVAYRHGLKNRSDLTVANTISGRDFRSRMILLITPEKGVTPVTQHELPARLVDLISQRMSKQHYRTEARSGVTFRVTLRDDIDRFRGEVRRLWKLNLFEPYHERADRHFGFLARRTAGGGFLITARGSNKEVLPADDIVYVSGVDFTNRVVHTHGRKASLNAYIPAKIFAERPEVKVILHAHVFPGIGSRTEVAYTPGTQEDLEECLKHLGNSEAVELVNHGIIVLGKDLDELIAALDVEPAYTRFAVLYDLLYARFRQSDDFLRLVEKHVAREQSVLDLGGGTGDLAEQLLRRGYLRVALADRQEAMLAVAGTRLPTLPRYQADMKDLRLPEPFDAILVRQAINYLMDPEGLVAGLHGICRSLSAGGVLLFNAPNHRAGREYGDRQLHYEAGDYVVRLREMNAVEGRLLVHTQNCMRYHKDGSEVRRVYDFNRFGLFTREEFETAAAQAGFSSIACYGKRLEDWTPESRSLYAVARK
jgi:phosphopantothenate-cysteine ligase